jgi:hypothetical protein
MNTTDPSLNDFAARPYQRPHDHGQYQTAAAVATSFYPLRPVDPAR